MAILSAGLLPTGNFDLPPLEGRGYSDYKPYNSSPFAIKESSDEKQIKVLLSFAKKIVAEGRPLDPDIAGIINEDFWEIYDRF